MPCAVINMQCLQCVILFYTITDKGKGMCEGASKQFTYLKNYTAPGLRPPVLKFLDQPMQKK